jgi:hypothetical protein
MSKFWSHNALPPTSAYLSTAVTAHEWTVGYVTSLTLGHEA